MAKIDDVVKTRFMNDKHRFVTNLMFTAGWVRNLSTEYLKPYGISSQQYNILRILKGAGDWMAMNDVKNVMIEKAPNATRLADKLIDKQLIERRRSETDRRVVYVKILPKGLDLITTADKEENEIMKAMNERITDEEAKLVSSILDRFRG